jgi:hypothetical protein
MSVLAVKISTTDPTFYVSRRSNNSKLNSLINQTKMVAAVLLIGPVVVGLAGIVYLTPSIALEGGYSLVMDTSFSWKHVFGIALIEFALQAMVPISMVDICATKPLSSPKLQNRSPVK